jgi:hypothetical protein
MATVLLTAIAAARIVAWREVSRIKCGPVKDQVRLETSTPASPVRASGS